MTRYLNTSATRLGLDEVPVKTDTLTLHPAKLSTAQVSTSSRRDQCQNMTHRKGGHMRVIADNRA
jgi:hypothetical protein